MFLRDMLNKQSIIQLTLLKVIIIIFMFQIVYIIYCQQNYWEKQILKFNNNLVIGASRLQTKIQSQVFTLQELKNDQNLTDQEKIHKINGLIQLIINNPNVYTVGYYDKELDLLIKSQADDQVSLDDIKSQILLPNESNYLLSSNNISGVILPIFYQGEVVGYAWAHAKNVVLSSFNEFSAIIILALCLSVLIILSIRKHMQQIETYLGKFCDMIINNDINKDKEHENILMRLPELNPILNKIAGFTDDLKQMNRTLESSKLNVIRIMEGISDGFYALDREWRFTFVNHKLKLVTDKDELVGKTIWEVFPQVANSLTFEKMQEVMSKNQSVHWEAGGFINLDQNHEYHAYPYKEGLTVFFRDVTEHKRQQQELGRLERLNLIGQLAAGISHEIRNPLTTVKGFLQLFLAKPCFVNDIEYFDLMISEIDRANSIITDFLSLAKSNNKNNLPHNINDVINKVFPMLQADAFNSNKEVATDLEPLPDIMINEDEIKQLILNLVRNGLEVTTEQGSVMISTYLKGDRVVLAIRDQGAGIPNEIQEKIGTPFFTTKETGTGLGLAISMGIAERHNAVFKFETGNNGTTFYTLFPTG